MKKVEYAPAVELSMSSLNPDGVRRVQAWFDYLKRWDEDEAVRKNSVPLPGHEGIYVLMTTTDIRIFFRIDGDTITVLDIAKLSAILASGGINIGGSAGVFWHTQGSAKSYSVAFFAEKVRRVVQGNFTFVIMTDRDDLADQIYRTFAGCGVTDDKTPRAASGKALKALLQENHRFVFSLVHKFNQEVKRDEPYSKRDDIIVISDEAHRTQSGKLARNMRLALPNASFIGFTGTPLFKHDHLTRRFSGRTSPATTSSAPRRTTRPSSSSTRTAARSSASPGST